MPAPTANDLAALAGREVNHDQAEAIISIVTARAASHTRGARLHGWCARRRHLVSDPDRKSADAGRPVRGGGH